MSVRQIGHRVPRHARGRHTSSKIVDAHTAPARSEGCEVRSDTPRSCRCPSLVYRPDCRSGCQCRDDHISMTSVVVVDDVRAVVVSITQPVAVSTDTVTYRSQKLQPSIGTAVVPSTLNMPSSMVSKRKITLKCMETKESTFQSLFIMQQL